jgi:hypothetical protein
MGRCYTQKEIKMKATFEHELVKRMIDEAVKAEREACAKIADEWAVGWPHPSQVIAERIRERT